MVFMGFQRPSMAQILDATSEIGHRGCYRSAVLDGALRHRL